MSSRYCCWVCQGIQGTHQGYGCAACMHFKDMPSQGPAGTLSTPAAKRPAVLHGQATCGRRTGRLCGVAGCQRRERDRRRGQQCGAVRGRAWHAGRGVLEGGLQCLLCPFLEATQHSSRIWCREVTELLIWSHTPWFWRAGLCAGPAALHCADAAGPVRGVAQGRLWRRLLCRNAAHPVGC